MDSFTPVPALVGGVLIGLSATLLFLTNGRIAGITGIVGGMIDPRVLDRDWRLAFVAGLGVGGIALALFHPAAVGALPHASPMLLVAAGLLVGFGTRMGNGCTSGHGVCGIPRGSMRSVVATVTFIGFGMLTVTLVRTLGLP